MNRIGVLTLLAVLSCSTAAFARTVNEVQQVPEPSSLAVLGIGGLLMLSRRLRRAGAAATEQNRERNGGAGEN